MPPPPINDECDAPLSSCAPLVDACFEAAVVGRPATPEADEDEDEDDEGRARCELDARLGAVDDDDDEADALPLAPPAFQPPFQPLLLPPLLMATSRSTPTAAADDDRTRGAD